MIRKQLVATPSQKSNHGFQHMGGKMTKAEAFDKAWRLAFKNDDFSIVDEIYHPDYSAPDPNTGIVVNLEGDKSHCIFSQGNLHDRFFQTNL